jgi:hypothetical protein
MPQFKTTQAEACATENRPFCSVKDAAQRDKEHKPGRVFFEAFPRNSKRFP